MEVINRVTKKPNNDKKIDCPNCKCTIKYNDSDIIDLDDDLELGYGFYCPDCEEPIYLEKYRQHQFPEAFWHFENNGYNHINDATIQERVNECVNSLEEGTGKAEVAWISSGDTLVMGIKLDDCDKIIVAQNYYEEEYNFKD